LKLSKRSSGSKDSFRIESGFQESRYRVELAEIDSNIPCSKHILNRGLWVSCLTAMNARWTPLTFVVLLLVLQSVIHGSSAAAPVDVVVGTSGADVTMNLVVNENLTSLPAMTVHLDSSNSSIITSPLQKAIQKIDPKATIASLTLSMTTLNSTGKWTLSENYNFHVDGLSVRAGTMLTSDLSFLFFNLTDPVIVAGNEINYVTRAYILASLSAQPQGTAYFINGHQTRDASIPGLTTFSLHLLDFTWVSPLSGWTNNKDILGQTTSWTLNPPDRYNLTLGPFSPEGVFLKAYEVVYHPQFQVTVRSLAVANGNAIRFDLPSESEIVMPALIIVAVILLVTTLLVDRSLTRQNVRRRKR